MKKRTVALLCAAVALLGVIFGGTMAWLNRGTDDVVNTFTTASVGLALKETTGPYIMAPGAVLDKDPKVVVAEDSASCYLFVEVFEENFERDPIAWEAAEGWKEIEGLNKETSDGKVTMRVFYREFDEKETKYTKDDEGNYVFSFLKGDQVKVSQTLTKTYMSDLKSAGDKSYPKLTFKAYAIQRDYLKDADGNDLTEESIVNIYGLAKKNAADTAET